WRPTRGPQGWLSGLGLGWSQARTSGKISQFDVPRGDVRRSASSVAEPSLRPERLERFLVLIEQPRLDDPVVFDPQEEQVGLLEDAIPAGPFRGGQGGRMHVAREDVDELRVERPVGELREFLKVREDRRLAPMIP